jgi:hypothetical protein
VSDLHLKCFHVFLRMSTHKESAADFMSAPSFGQLVYDKFIFDVPRIIDIAVVFHTVKMVYSLAQGCHIFLGTIYRHGSIHTK